MSTTYEIYKFAKPTLKELSIVDYYSDYDVFSILLRLPIPKMGFVPRKFNISANKIAIYAITVCG